MEGLGRHITQLGLLLFALLSIMANPSVNNITLKNIRVAHWNARGIKNKTDILNQFLIEHNIDVLLVQETHLKPQDTLKLSGYKIKRAGEKDPNPGAGLLLAYREQHECVIHRKLDNEKVQLMTCTIFINKIKKIAFTNFYRKLQDSKNDDIKSSLDQIDHSINNHIICGDFNINASKLHLLDNFILENDLDLHNNMSIPTRIGGINQQDSILDLTMSVNRKKNKPRQLECP